MDVGKLLGITRQVRFRSGLLAREYLFLRFGKMFGHAFHLSGGLWQFGIFIVRRDAVAEEKQAVVVLLLIVRSAITSACCTEYTQRAGICNRRVFNPIVQLGFGD